MKINEKNLIAYSVSPSPIQKEGYLLKRGEVNKVFQKRWFVLKGNLLFYFERKGDKEPLGVIILEACTIELDECDEQVCSFRIIFPGREYILAADTQELLEAWMKCLARASYSYLKMMVAELEAQLEELQIAEQQAAADQASQSVVNSSTRSGPHRLNPFNTPEENRNLLWAGSDCSSVTSSESQVMLPSSLIPPPGHSAADTSRGCAVWHGSQPDGIDVYSGRGDSGVFKCSSSSAISDTLYKNSSNNNSVFYDDCDLNEVRNRYVKSSSSEVALSTKTSTFFIESHIPVPPKRHKKSQKDGSHCQEAAKRFGTNLSHMLQYSDFAQLHLDYGASILRDRELHKIRKEGLLCEEVSLTSVDNQDNNASRSSLDVNNKCSQDLANFC